MWVKDGGIPKLQYLPKTNRVFLQQMQHQYRQANTLNLSNQRCAHYGIVKT